MSESCKTLHRGFDSRRRLSVSNKSGGATLDEAAILEDWGKGLETPGHDVMRGRGPCVPDESSWQDTPHWKVDERDPLPVRIR